MNMTTFEVHVQFNKHPVRARLSYLWMALRLCFRRNPELYINWTETYGDKFWINGERRL